MKLSEEKKQVTEIDTGVICLYEALCAFDSHFILPEELQKKVFDIIEVVEHEYCFLPKSKNGVEILEDTYTHNVSYKELLD